MAACPHPGFRRAHEISAWTFTITVVTHPDVEGTRTCRLVLSGSVIQWRPDGLWRRVSAKQFELEQSRDPRLPAVWSQPEPSKWRQWFSTGTPSTAEGESGWWFHLGNTPAEGTIIARYADGTEAPVVIAGPIWCVEGRADRWLASIEIGHEVHNLRNQALLHRTLTGSDDHWWGRDTVTPTVFPEGVAYVTWQDNSHDRLRRPDEPAVPNGYSCNLAPFAPNDQPREFGPELPTLDQALAWARARTSHIIVRPEWDPANTYYATDAPPQEWEQF